MVTTTSSWIKGFWIMDRDLIKLSIRSNMFVPIMASRVKELDFHTMI